MHFLGARAHAHTLTHESNNSGYVLVLITEALRLLSLHFELFVHYPILCHVGFLFGRDRPTGGVLSPEGDLEVLGVSW